MAAQQASPYRTALAPAAGRLLVATADLDDPNFRRSVVYLLEHDEDAGTVGVVVNRPSRTPVGQVLPSWHDVMSEPAVVFNGGPVQADGALCLGELRERADRDVTSHPVVRTLVDAVATVDLDSDVGTASDAVRRLRVFAGHSGWGGGQLAAEVDQGGWYVVPGRASDVFGEHPQDLWRAALRRQPMPLRMLASYPADPGQT